MASPTSRTVELLRGEGYTVQVVERWNSFAGVRVDLFDAIDLVAVKPGEPVMGVQATSSSNMLARCRKAAASDRMMAWIATEHARFFVIGWDRRSDGRYWPLAIEMMLDDWTEASFEPHAVSIPEESLMF